MLTRNQINSLLQLLLLDCSITSTKEPPIQKIAKRDAAIVPKVLNP